MREIKLGADDAHDQLAKEILERSSQSAGGRTSRDAWNIYLQKTYLKTASLMAKGARLAVVLGGCCEGEVWKEIAYAYGRNLGIAFQVRRSPSYRLSLLIIWISSWMMSSTTNLPVQRSGSPVVPILI